MNKEIKMIVVLLVIAIVFSLISIMCGVESISFSDFMHALMYDDAEYRYRIFYIRGPRVLLAWPVAISICISGVIIQKITMNELSSPDLIGITAGANLFAATAFLVFNTHTLWSIPLFSFLGAMLTSLFIYMCAIRINYNIVYFAIIGVAVSAMLDACFDYLMVINADSAEFIAIRLKGSLWASTWDHLFAIMPWFIAWLPISIMLSFRLNIIGLGDSIAHALGFNALLNKSMMLFVAIALAASSVAVSGAMIFLGLVSPHIGRVFVGYDSRYLIPVSALTGIIILLLADIIGRLLFAPVEIPASILIALLGGPYFMYLLIHAYKKSK